MRIAVADALLFRGYRRALWAVCRTWYLDVLSLGNGSVPCFLSGIFTDSLESDDGSGESVQCGNI